MRTRQRRPLSAEALAFMKERVVVLLIFGLVAGACESEPVITTVEWRGRPLREVHSVAQIPALVRLSLGVDRPGLDGVADRGRPFNATDVVDQRVPMRRFLVAGQDGDTWLVAIEHGGRGYSVEVFLFIAQQPTPREKWVLLDRPTNLAEVVRQISHGKAA